MRKILAGFIGALLMLSFATALVGAQDSNDTEPNNDFWDAVYVYDGNVISGSLDDSTDIEDYYQIWLNYGDTLTVYMTGTGDDFDLVLYDWGESWVDDSTNAGPVESITYTVVDSGYHYIVPNADLGSGTYELTITVFEYTGGGGNGGIVEGTGPGAQLPEWTIGDGWSFGKVVDLEKEFKDEIDEGLAEIRNQGFDANVDVAGGLGVYLGVEVIDDDKQVNGYECYDVKVTGGIGIDFSLDARVKGSMDIYGTSISIDGDGSAYAVGEAILDGHVYYTVDNLAIAKIDLTLTAELEAEAHIDATMTTNDVAQRVKLDASIDVVDVEITFQLSFDPPVDMFQFPVKVGDVWYVPRTDTTVSGVLNAKGTVTTEVTGSVPGEPPMDDKQIVNLATEIGDNNFSEVVPGGPGGYDDYYNFVSGTRFECTQLIGDNIYIIETSAGDAMALFDFGTRQDVTDFLPIDDLENTKAGMQYNANEGFITGATMNGEVVTDQVTMEEVETFVANPQGEVADETGGRADSGGLIGLLLLLIIVILVVVVIVVIAGKKKPQQPQYYQPQQQQYQDPNQPQYYQEQPPPTPEQPPQQYPPQDQQPPPPPPPEQ